MESLLNENRDKLPEQMATEFDNMLVEAKEAKNSGDLAKIEEASGKLNALLQQIAQASQGAAGPEGAQQGGATQQDTHASADDDVIDVDVVED